jgi:RNA polymerase sigma factor for flagellar operon FliA
MEAWRELFDKYRTLPRRLAVKYKQKLPACVDVDDLEQCGLMGLMEAAKKFDPARGVRFTTYAGRRILGAMVDGIRDMDWGPRYAHGKGGPTMVSMEAVVSEGGDGKITLLEAIDARTPDPGLELAQTDAYDHMVSCLPWRWREIVSNYYGGEYTSRELSESLGLTESRIFQILAECRKILRGKLERQSA